MEKQYLQAPTAAFIGASWVALFIGAGAYLIGLWSAQMQLNEKGYYFTILMYGLFSSVSLQKTVRDRMEGIEVTGIYFGLCWISVGISLLLLSVGLWNATIVSSEKAFMQCHSYLAFLQPSRFKKMCAMCVASALRRQCKP
jgi:uncharacterized membrane protein YiaA